MGFVLVIRARFVKQCSWQAMWRINLISQTWKQKVFKT